MLEAVVGDAACVCDQTGSMAACYPSNPGQGATSLGDVEELEAGPILKCPVLMLLCALLGT